MKLITTKNSLNKSLETSYNPKDYQTIADLMKEQNVSNDKTDYWKTECAYNSSNPNCLI